MDEGIGSEEGKTAQDHLRIAWAGIRSRLPISMSSFNSHTASFFVCTLNLLSTHNPVDWGVRTSYT